MATPNRQSDIGHDRNAPKRSPLLHNLVGYTPQRHFSSRNIQLRGSRQSTGRVESWRQEVMTETSIPETSAVEDNNAPKPGMPSRIQVLRQDESTECDAECKDVRHEDASKPVTPALKDATRDITRSSSRASMLRGQSRESRSVLPAPRVRQGAGMPVRWIKPIEKPPPPPIFPTPKTLPPVRTYKTLARSTLPEASQHSSVDDQGAEGDDAEGRHLEHVHDMEPRTSSFQYEVDDSPEVMSQEEDKTLEEYLRGARRPPVLEDQREETADVSESPEAIDQGLDVAEGDHPEVNQSEEQKEPSQGLDEPSESLSEMEIELLQMGGSYESRSTSGSSSPKRPRSPVSDAQSEGEQQFVKKRRTGRRVPSVENRRAVLQKLTKKRASKIVNQTSDIARGVTDEKALKVAQPTGDTDPANTANVEKPKKKAKKEPRRIPDHGQLVTGPERLDSDVEDATTPPLELSQDPISQVAVDQEEVVPARYQRGTRAMKVKLPKSFKTLDISLYNIPEPLDHQNPIARIIAYSDGFTEKEREPTGRTMPIKQPGRRKESYQHVTIRYGQLSLVSEKPSDTPDEPRRQKKKSHKPKKVPPKSIVPEPEEDPMLLDEQSEEMHPIILNPPTMGPAKPQTPVPIIEPKIVRPRHIDPKVLNLRPTVSVAKPQTPVVEDRSLLSSTPAGNSSPLKRMSQSVQCGPNASQQLQPRVESQNPTGQQQKEGSMSRMPSIITALGKTRKQIRDDMVASQEISRVTMKRTGCHRDEDRGSVDREVADGNDQEPDKGSEGEPEEDETCPPLMDEEEDEVQEEDASRELDLELESDSQHAETGGGAKENLDNQTSDPAEIVDGPREDLQLLSRSDRTGHMAMSQPHLQEIANMVLELQQETVSEKARLRDKQQIPRLSQPVRKRYPSNIESREPQSSQQLPRLVDLPDSLKTEPRSSQIFQPFSFDADSSWRPRVPDTSGPAMQVDENIDDSPTPPREREKAALSRRRSMRRLSSVRSQSLQTVSELPESPSFDDQAAVTHDSQGGSLILGNTQNFRRTYPTEIEETQEPMAIEEEETHTVMVANTSYFSQASEQLSQPIRMSRINRTLSTPGRARSRVHFDLHQRADNNGLMANGMSMTAAFQHTVSPAKTSSSPFKPLSQRQTPSQQRTPSQGKSLKELTRTASRDLGTLHGSARKMSMPLEPLLKTLPRQTSTA